MGFIPHGLHRCAPWLGTLIRGCDQVPWTVTIHTVDSLPPTFSMGTGEWDDFRVSRVPLNKFTHRSCPLTRFGLKPFFFYLNAFFFDILFLKRPTGGSKPSGERKRAPLGRYAGSASRLRASLYCLWIFPWSLIFVLLSLVFKNKASVFKMVTFLPLHTCLLSKLYACFLQLIIDKFEFWNLIRLEKDKWKLDNFLSNDLYFKLGLWVIATTLLNL